MARFLKSAALALWESYSAAKAKIFPGLVGLAAASLFLAAPVYAQVGGGPSIFCHETDGAFTICPDTNEEWSDIVPQFFPESDSYLYVDQADLDPILATPESQVDTFMLMYDECSQTEPLGANEYVRVGFTTVEVEGGIEALEHYVIHIFTDGTIIFIEDGTPQTDGAGEVRVEEIEGQRGAVGFGPSPNCAFDHVFAEFEIKLTATGVALDGGYSPDPQFWGAQAPCDLKCRFAKCAAVFGAIAVVAGPASATPCDGFCTGAAIGAGLTAAYYAYRAADPPDPNFMVIVEPVIPAFTPVTVGNVGTQEAADAANALLDNLAQILGFEGAVLTSIERAQGAAEAGDDFFETEQLQAAALFSTQLADLYEAQIVLLENTQSNLQSAGFPSFAVTATDISNFQDDVINNGLPNIFTDFLALTSLATRSDATQVLEDSILSVDPNDAAGSFPEILTDTQLIASIQDTAALHDEFARSVPGFVPPIQPGFDGNTLPANDDGSTGLVPIGFPVDFFGATFETLFVNNNGNVTFDAALGTFTPFPLTSTNRVIIAPFFADVDTRVGNVVTYGQGTVNGRPAFGVNWPGVGCFSVNTSVLNFFQLRLIDRSDVGPGDFDIQFGYDQIQWETGQASGGNVICQGGASARVGYSNGTGAPGTFFELPGSGVPGAFLDSNLETGLKHISPLRFAVRSGMPVEARDRDSDDVLDELDNCPTTPNPDQADSNFNGIGDLCEIAGSNSTAAFLQAGADGSTTVEPTPLPFAEEPSLLEKLVRIVEFRVEEGLTNSAEALTQNLVDSLVGVGLVDAGQAAELIQEVLAALFVSVTVDIDIKPGSDPNCFNNNGHGVIPVAILGSDGSSGFAPLNASDIDTNSVSLEGLGVALRGKNILSHLEDVNGDNLIDLVVQIEDMDAAFLEGSTIANLTGELMDGTPIEGTDSICIVP